MPLVRRRRKASVSDDNTTLDDIVRAVTLFKHKIQNVWIEKSRYTNERIVRMTIPDDWPLAYAKRIFPKAVPGDVIFIVPPRMHKEMVKMVKIGVPREHFNPPLENW
jgi:hypothetical protein